MLRFAHIALAMIVAAPAAAQTTVGQASPSSVELLAGWPGEDGGRVAGLRIRIDDGWKTYWRAPGESGVPPLMDWTGSENVADIQVDWPRPDLFRSFGLRTIGYHSNVTLPLRIKVEDPQKPVRLRLSMDYGVCSTICMPEHATASLDIAPGTREVEPALVAATHSLPTPARDAGLLAAACQVAGAGAERRFSGAFRFDQGFAEPPVVVVEGPSGVWFAPTSVTQDGDAVSVDGEVALDEPDLWIDRSDLRVTFLTQSEVLDLKGCEG